VLRCCGVGSVGAVGLEMVMKNINPERVESCVYLSGKGERMVTKQLGSFRLCFDRELMVGGVSDVIDQATLGPI
jgi:hypothetical protein